MARTAATEKRKRAHKSGTKRVVPKKIESKKARNHAGTVARRRVRALQRSTDPILPFAFVSRVMRDMLPTGARCDRASVEVVREVIERECVDTIRNAVRIGGRSKSKTVRCDDLRLARFFMV